MRDTDLDIVHCIFYVGTLIQHRHQLALKIAGAGMDSRGNVKSDQSRL